MTSRLAGLPSATELQQQATELLDQLPDYSLVQGLRGSVQEGLASLPSREQVVQGVQVRLAPGVDQSDLVIPQSAFDMIPAAEEVNTNLDTAVNV